jgi:glycosyltransferase involved in cell wall biosynthesis
MPVVSVVIEGYNESLSLGSVAETMDGLRRQDFPLGEVEVILVGSEGQAEAWAHEYADPAPFRSVRTLSRPGAHYYELKNEGARAASGEIVVLTDSDVRPEPGWLTSIAGALGQDAEVTAGISLFRGEDGRRPDHPLLQVAASISWGFVIGRVLDERAAEPRAFLSHNVGFRADTFRRHPYRTDLGRTLAGSFLYKELTSSGVRIELRREQRVAHTFSLGWWLGRLHRRFGYEVYLLRRLDRSAPRRWLLAVRPVEPLLTMIWHVFLDVPQWVRYGSVMRIPLWRRAALLPLLVGMSVLARGAELVGMYQTMVAPAAMKRFAESN